MYITRRLSFDDVQNPAAKYTYQQRILGYTRDMSVGTVIHPQDGNTLFIRTKVYVNVKVWLWVLTDDPRDSSGGITLM